MHGGLIVSVYFECPKSLGCVCVRAPVTSRAEQPFCVLRRSLGWLPDAVGARLDLLPVCVDTSTCMHVFVGRGTLSRSTG